MSNSHEFRGAKRALLVANAKYDSAKLAPLPCTRVDVEQLRAVLAHPGIGAFEVEVALDLSSHELKLRVESFLGALEPDDLGFLYMSGHGARLKSSTGEFLFLTPDTVSAAELDGRTAVSATFLDERLVSCRANRKVVVLDACFSGGYALSFRTTDSKAAGSKEGALLCSRGCYILSSSTLEQASYAGPARAGGKPGPSVFTGHLVESLRTGQGDRNRDGMISVDELFEDVSVRLRHGGNVQTPVMSSLMVSGRIDLAKRVTGAPPDLDLICSQTSSDAPVSKQAVVGESGRPSWPNLLQYYRNCLEASLNSFPLLSAADQKTRYICATGPERIAAGFADEDGSLPLRAGDSVREFLGDDESQVLELYYGYPIVVLREGEQSRGQTHFAPLFVQKLRVDGDRMFRDGPLVLHPTLKNMLLQRANADGALLSKYRPNWSGGNLADACQQIVWVLQRLGLECQLDMTQLAPIELGAPSTRACNSGVYFLEPKKAPSVADRVIKELSQIEKSSSRITETALGSFLLNQDGSTPVDTRFPLKWRSCTPLPFNDAQMLVLRSAMTQKLTVTMGPPGTGKSQLVANIVASCIASDQRVLLATTNNRAVDVVCERLNKVVGDAIVRTGNQEAKLLEAEQIDRLAKQATTTKRSPTNATTAAQDADAEHENLEAVRRSFGRAATAENDLLSALLRRTDAENVLSDRWNMSVADVRSRLQRADLMRWRALVALAARLTVLAGLVRFLVLCFFGMPTQTHGKAFSAFAEWVAATYVVLSRRQIIAAQHDDDTLSRRLQEAENGVRLKAKTLLELMVEGGARAGKEKLASLVAARGPRRPDWRELGAVLRHVRAWAVTALSVRRFPLYVGQGNEIDTPFDLVIVDEASQCQIADIFPVLFRAKRALIIGDPMQLGPIGELSPSQQSRAREAAGLTAAWLDDMCLSSYRYSVFHAAQRAAPVTHLLDEHYRCHPHIAQFANTNFYQGNLVVLTPSLSRAGARRAIEWVNVPGEAVRRASSWINEQEADAVAALATMLLQEDPTCSVGVVSPLRPQKDLLDDRLKSVTGIKSGAVHTFQGGEQDVIILSLVLGPEMATGTRNWLAGQRNLWNVAVTRARKRLIVVGHRAEWLKQGGIGALLAEAVEHVDNDNTDDFRVRLHRKLRDDGLDAELGAEVGGYEVDAVVSGVGDHTVALNVDRGCGLSDPAKHFGIQLKRTELLSIAGEGRAVRIPAWRLFDDESQLLLDSEHARGENTGHRFDSVHSSEVVGGAVTAFTKAQ
jgi:hypothetical protein